MDNKLLLKALKRFGITELIPFVGDWIFYFLKGKEEINLSAPLIGKLFVPIAGMVPFLGTGVWLWDLLQSGGEPSPDDIDRLEGRGRDTGRSSRRRGRPTTDGGQVVTGGGSDDDDGGSGIPSTVLKGLFSVGVLVGLLFVGTTIVSGTLGDYGQVAAEEVQDETVGGIAPDISEDVTAGVQNGVGAVRCIGAGPACIQEWRLENSKTERPDSEDATKSFDLSVRSFQLGREGEAFDISSESAEEGIPIEMRIFNNRRGIDGIDARDVEFRILMVNGEFDARTPLCDTGWVPVDKVPQLPAYDADGDGEADDLPPGTGLSSGFLRLDKDRVASSVDWDGDYITPKSCHLLQPGVGEEAEVRLGVRYEYFSSAGLIFEAMSNSYIQSSQSIRRDTTQSLSPDTPVQAGLSLDGPVPALDDRPSSFSLRALMETDEDNVQFVTQDMRIINSREACIQGTGISSPECVNDPGEEALDCSFKPSSDSQNVLIPKESTLEEYRGKGPGGRTFFDDQQSPQTAGCQMMLRNPESISRTGETLAIRMEANYTVIKDRPDDFKAANLICTEKNCPHVFALSGDTLDAEHLGATQSLLFGQDSGQDSSEAGSSSEVFWRHRRAECDGLTDDGPNEPGCTVVSGDVEEGFRQATAVQGGVEGPDGELQIIEEGKIAVDIEDTSKDIFTACVRKDSVRNPDAMTGVHGIESSRLYTITGDDADPQLNWTGAEWELEDEESPCKGSSGSRSDGSGSEGGASTSENEIPTRGIHDETVENTQDSSDGGASSEDENTADDPYDYTAENSQDSSDGSTGLTEGTYSGT
jgi:hypothetical protein